MLRAKPIPFSSDNAHGRILQTQLPDSQTLTVESCIQACAAQNFTVAGIEFSSEFPLPHVSLRNVPYEPFQHNAVSLPNLEYV